MRYKRLYSIVSPEISGVVCLLRDEDQWNSHPGALAVSPELIWQSGEIDLICG